MAPKIHDCVQGDDEWHRLRLGIPTASEFATVMAKPDSKDRQRYLRELVGERLNGEPRETYSNRHMERGKEQEPETRSLYAFAERVKVQQIGFATNHGAGCSPDGLIGKKGACEFKVRGAHIVIELLQSDKFPTGEIAQCQGALWILEREWIDLGVYCRGIPLFIKRATRDETYIRALAQAVGRFNYELDELERKIRRIGAPEKPARRRRK